MSSNTRGNGFLHLNTPTSIQYTVGQTLTVTDLSRKRTRVECTTLPASQAVWRRAFAFYKKQEGYADFAADAEAERAGDGPLLPLMAPVPPSEATEPFFVKPTGAVAVGSTGPSPLTTGISIASHHKVSGATQFVYPDHDGVLSTGVVPQVVLSADEAAGKEASRKYYVTELTMDEGELAAYEELQLIWKSRHRSHSFLGAQHRAAVGGCVAPGEDERRTAHSRAAPHKSTSLASPDTAELDLPTADAGDSLAEALSMADDLLRLA